MGRCVLPIKHNARTDLPSLNSNTIGQAITLNDRLGERAEERGWKEGCGVCVDVALGVYIYRCLRVDDCVLLPVSLRLPPAAAVAAAAAAAAAAVVLCSRAAFF